MGTVSERGAERIAHKEIDNIDAKIIRDLLGDARKSFVKIAAECNVSTATIGDRFTELEKAGIIVGSTIQIHHGVTGCNTTCSALVKVDREEIEQVTSYIRSLPFEIPLVFQGPRNDIVLIAGLKDINEVGRLKEIIRRNRFVLELKTEIWTDVRNMPEKLADSKLPGTGEQRVMSFLPKKHMDIDTLDFQLIEKLEKDSMQPFGKIAKEIGTSINTVSRKYTKLTENGIIRSIIQLDPTKLGYYAVANFALAFASQSDTNSVIKEVMDIKDNVLIIKTSGEYDLFVYVMLRDINQLLSTQSQVAKISGISRIESMIYPPVVPWPTSGEYISTF
jgi:Lrp/AsnC family transcriptional regulator for asnA, asnC and gidA